MRAHIAMIGGYRELLLNITLLSYNLIWGVSPFLIGWKVISIFEWMKKIWKPRPFPELLPVVTASTQSKLIGTNSSSH